MGTKRKKILDGRQEVQSAAAEATSASFCFSLRTDESANGSRRDLNGLIRTEGIMASITAQMGV